MDFIEHAGKVLLLLPYTAQMESGEQSRTWLVIASLLL